MVENQYRVAKSHKRQKLGLSELWRSTNNIGESKARNPAPAWLHCQKEKPICHRICVQTQITECDIPAKAVPDSHSKVDCWQGFMVFGNIQCDCWNCKGARQPKWQSVWAHWSVKWGTRKTQQGPVCHGHNVRRRQYTSWVQHTVRLRLTQKLFGETIERTPGVSPGVQVSFTFLEQRNDLSNHFWLHCN